jgi:hypothetical protein
MDLLDDTRIHPLQYSIAIELSKAAWLAAQNLSEDEANPDDLEMAVQEVAGQLASEPYFQRCGLCDLQWYPSNGRIAQGFFSEREKVARFGSQYNGHENHTSCSFFLLERVLLRHVKGALPRGSDWCALSCHYSVVF